MKKLTIITSLVCMFSFSHAQIVFGDSIPVRLSYLDGNRNGNSNQLNWAVACFLQYANFEIQRSENGITYSTVHTFRADELRCRQPFSYTDLQPAEKSFYRIRVGDLDGKFYSSKIVALYGRIKGFDITSITPNIIADNATLNLSSSSFDKVEIIITSATGIIVKRISYSLQNGSNAISLQLTGIMKGYYFLSVKNSEGEARVSQFVKR